MSLSGPLFIDTLEDVSVFDGQLAFLLRESGGDIKKINFVPLIQQGMYALSCMTDTAGNVTNPTWQNGFNKLYTACDEVRVGIGTSAPSEKLHVIGNGHFSGSLSARRNMGIGGSPVNGSALKIVNDDRDNSIEIDQTGNTIEYQKLLYLQYDEPSTEIIKVRNSSTDRVTFLVDASGKMFLDNGTKKIFQVNADGLAQTREVLVDLEEWPDYVFDKGYKLMPLEEVEKYIIKEGHLPNVPSAETVEEEGVKLGEMNKLLMEKIEELTLHLIEQDKKITELQKQISNQH